LKSDSCEFLGILHAPSANAVSYTIFKAEGVILDQGPQISSFAWVSKHLLADSVTISEVNVYY